MRSGPIDVGPGDADDAALTRLPADAGLPWPPAPAVAPSRRLAVRRSGRERLVGLWAVLGGLLVAGGAFLPWLSFYAGLYPMRGVVGPWGRLLAAGGVLCALLGARCWWRRGRALEWAIVLLAGASGAFTLWLLLQLALTWRGLRANPMLVPRVGPGLFVVLTGALLALAPAVGARLRRRT